MVDPRRVRDRNAQPIGKGPVLYWMERDQRAEDNWALLHAQSVAMARNVPLLVVYSLVPNYGQMTWRQYAFMCAGLAEVETDLRRRHIPFYLQHGSPSATIPSFVHAHGEIGRAHV